jgi:hypothetical protein
MPIVERVRNSDVTFVLIEANGDSDLVDGEEEDGTVGDLLSLGDLPTALSSPAADLPTAAGPQSVTSLNATTAAVRDETSSTAAVHDETAPLAAVRDETSASIDAAYFDSHCADCKTQFKVSEVNCYL